MTKISLYSMGYYLHLYAHISSYISSKYPRLYEFTHIVHSRRAVRLLSNRYHLNHRTYNLPVYLMSNWHDFHVSPQLLRAMEERYGDYWPRGLMLSDFHIFDLRYDRLLKLLVGHFRFFEDFVNRERPDCVLSERRSILSTSVAWTVCKREGIQLLSYIPFHIQRRFYLSSHQLGIPEEIGREYARLSREGLSSAEAERATRYLCSFMERPQKYLDAIYWGRQPKLRWSAIHRFVVELFDFSLRDARYYVEENALQKGWRNLKELARYRMYALCDVFEKPVSEEKYVLFALASDNECCLHSIAPFTYANQLEVVRQVAWSLPMDCKLYVKEHTSRLGHRPLSFLQEVKKIPNVRLIGPGVDSFDLLKKCSAVVLLHGSMAWEGLLFGKAVIGIGESWYDFFPGVFRAGDPKDFFGIIREAVRNYRPDEAALVRLIGAVLNTAMEGYVWHYDRERVFGTENVGALSEALLGRLAAGDACFGGS